MISTRYAQYPDPLKFSSTSLVRDPMALEPELSGIVINNLLQYKLQIFIRSLVMYVKQVKPGFTTTSRSQSIPGP